MAMFTELAVEEWMRRARSATRNEHAQIVREEWHKAVEEFHLHPGSPTEAVVARILQRLAETEE